MSEGKLPIWVWVVGGIWFAFMLAFGVYREGVIWGWWS